MGQSSILIVDDSESLRRSLSLILERKGYAVNGVGNGPEAVMRAREEPFDVIFLDVKMLPLNGLETYRRLKDIHPTATVIMMTAYAVEDLVQAALNEGAYEVVYKPLDIKRVLALIEEVS